MDQAHRSLKQVDQDQQQTPPQDLPFLPHKLNKEVMVGTQAISNKDMVFTVVRLEPNMGPVSVRLEGIKLLDKVTKTTNTEATKASEATTIMAIASNVADGVATMDTKQQAHW
jgi:hypothetical protein